MSARYPHDADDAAGSLVEQNNSSLVADGARTSPAVRLPTASDPCKAYVINAPAKQLRDRLALLEAKTPLMGEAAAINDGNLALQGNITAQGTTAAITRSIEVSAASQNWEDLGENAAPRFWLHGLTWIEADGTPTAEGAVVSITGVATYTANADGEFRDTNDAVLGTIAFLAANSGDGEIMLMWTNKFSGSLTYPTGGSEVIEGVVTARRVEAQATKLTSEKTIGSVVHTHTQEADGEGVTFTRAEGLSGNYQQDVRFTVKPQYDSAHGARIECAAHAYDAEGMMLDDLGVALQAEKLRVNEIYEPINGQAGQICVHSELQVNGPVRTTGDVTAAGDITAGSSGTITGAVLQTGGLQGRPGATKIALNASLESQYAQTFAAVKTDALTSKTNGGTIAVNSPLALAKNILTAPNCVKGWRWLFQNAGTLEWMYLLDESLNTSLSNNEITCDDARMSIMFIHTYSTSQTSFTVNQTIISTGKTATLPTTQIQSGALVVFF